MKVSFDEKIVRRLKNTKDFLLKDFLGTKKTKELQKGFELMKEKERKAEVVPLSIYRLERFYHEVYAPFIAKKQNAEVFNLISRFSDRIQENKEELYFAKITNWSTLLAGGVFVMENKQAAKILSLAYRAYDEVTVNKQRLGNYIEALYFLHGKTLEVDWFSAGQDRNGYGYFGGSLGLALHKLENYFLPMRAENPLLREEELDFDEPTLIFQDSNDNGYFKRAVLYNPSSAENLIKIQEMFQKRGLELILK